MARPQWQIAGRAKPGGKRHRERGPEAVKLLKRLGARIKKMRLDRGLTGGEVAAAIGITPPIQFVRESGAISMPVEDLARYAKVLKCKAADLVK